MHISNSNWDSLFISKANFKKNDCNRSGLWNSDIFFNLVSLISANYSNTLAEAVCSVNPSRILWILTEFPSEFLKNSTVVCSSDKIRSKKLTNTKEEKAIRLLFHFIFGIFQLFRSEFWQASRPQ